jgi:transcriptional regulator with XRE-family HTH domain
MARAFSSPQHNALRAFLAKKREESGLHQVDLARKLKRRQDYVSDIETGQKVVTVVELMEWAAALGFDPHEALRVLKGK